MSLASPEKRDCSNVYQRVSKLLGRDPAVILPLAARCIVHPIPFLYFVWSTPYCAWYC
jgi:hypothetical protein